ncbi:MAG: carboxypeptidase-like regulatory domain-containing protein [Candidatus Rokuibacteriota bacterium]
MSTDPGSLDPLLMPEMPSPLAAPAEDGMPLASETAPEAGTGHEWRSRYTGFLHLPLSRVQAIIGITAGVLSITGMLFPALRTMYPTVGRGEVIAVVRDAQSGAPVPDATVEILTPDNAIVTTLLPGAGGRVRHTVKEGAYRVQVKHPGFAVERRQILVMAGQAAEIRFRLAPLATGSTMSPAAMPLLDAAPRRPAPPAETRRDHPTRNAVKAAAPARRPGGESP